MTNAISNLSVPKQIGLAMGIAGLGYLGEKVNSKALMIISGLGLLALGFAHAVNYCSKPSGPKPSSIGETKSQSSKEATDKSALIHNSSSTSSSGVPLSSPQTSSLNAQTTSDLSTRLNTSPPTRSSTPALSSSSSATITSFGYVESKLLMIISGLGLVALGFRYLVRYCSKTRASETKALKPNPDTQNPTLPTSSSTQALSSSSSVATSPSSSSFSSSSIGFPTYSTPFSHDRSSSSSSAQALSSFASSSTSTSPSFSFLPLVSLPPTLPIIPNNVLNSSSFSATTSSLSNLFPVLAFSGSSSTSPKRESSPFFEDDTDSFGEVEQVRTLSPSPRPTSSLASSPSTQVAPSHQSPVPPPLLSELVLKNRHPEFATTETVKQTT